ncbi:MAG: 2-phospho-L-lactate transferase [Nitriliruptorales bacterium]|nr:2-phospho-L-lactate transferase [Nitriliruptorales bacterium]
MTVTALAGGVGAARFLRGLVKVVDPQDVTVIVNVGDDIELHGLRVCPDLDSITYWLAGVVHPDQQWGRADETFAVASELERFGEPRWFTLGDRDLALHVHRTRRLREGAPLSQVTAEVVAAFGLSVRLLPATDHTVATRVTTTDGRDLHFQEWWVGEQAEGAVERVRLEGAEHATAGPGVIDAITAAEHVIICPSNPIVSIDTILAVPGIRAALEATSAPVVGISPIVGGAVVRGMADRLLPAVGVEVSAAGVAEHYAPFLDGWVIDQADAGLRKQIAATGLDVTVMDTMLDSEEQATAVAKACLAMGRARA